MQKKYKHSDTDGLCNVSNGNQIVVAENNEFSTMKQDIEIALGSEPERFGNWPSFAERMRLMIN